MGDLAAIPSASATLPVKYGSPTVPMPGYDLQVLDEKGQLRPGRQAALLVIAAAAAGCAADALGQRRALPQELSRRLPGHYTTSDAGYRDEDGYAYVMARTDDVINRC